MAKIINMKVAGGGHKLRFQITQIYHEIYFDSDKFYLLFRIWRLVTFRLRELG